MDNPMKNYLLFPVFLIAAEMITYLSIDMYLPALTAMMKTFSLTPHQAQLTLSAWFIGSASLQLIIGPLADRFGRRPILISGLILFLLSSLICTFSTHLALFLAARFIQGTTVCFVIVAGYASIHELFTQKQAIQLLATMNSVIVLAPALGPFIGGLILQVGSWRWIFALLSLLSCIVLLALSKWMPEPLARDQRQPLKIKVLVTQYFSILSNQRFILLILSYCLLFAGFISWLVIGPFLVIDVFHYQPYVFGLYQVLIFSFYIVANNLVKYLMTFINITLLIACGLSINLLGGLLAIGLAYFEPQILSGLIIGMIFSITGFGLASAPLQRLTIESSTEPMGSRMALLSTFLGSFGLIATFIAGLVYNGQLLALGSIMAVTATLANVLFLKETLFSAKVFSPSPGIA